MYRNLEIKNFRCFKHLKIEELERINLIAGKNGAGKSSLLEAVFLHAGAYNPELVMSIQGLRGIEQVKLARGAWVETPFDSIFRDFNSKEKIEIAATLSPNGKRSITLKVLREKEELSVISTASQPISQNAAVAAGVVSADQSFPVLELEYKDKRNKKGKTYLILSESGVRITPAPPPPPFPAHIITGHHSGPSKDFPDRFGKIETQLRKQEVVDVLKIVEPRIKDLTIVHYAGKPILHANIGLRRLVPLFLMGGGIMRLTALIVELIKAENGIILFDEIENGLHSSALEEVWTAIGEAARRNNTQVFATTHSFECITAAHRAISRQDKYSFKLHRLDRVDEEIQHVAYSRDGLDAAIEMNFEVR